VVLISPGLYFPFFVLIDSKSTRFWINSYISAAISSRFPTPSNPKPTSPLVFVRNPLRWFFLTGGNGFRRGRFWISIQLLFFNAYSNKLFKKLHGRHRIRRRVASFSLSSPCVESIFASRKTVTIAVAIAI
jgi:hypothetical protein